MLSRGITIGVLAASFNVALLAQAASQTAATPAGTVAASVVPGLPIFEVTIVKPSKVGDAGSHSSYKGGRYIASNVLLKNVMQYSAYGVPQVQIVGGPKWLDSERFDIEAKADDTVAKQLETADCDERRRLMQGMFQQLLTERFKLAVHWDTRELPVYALVAGAGKGLLQPAKHPEHGAGTSSRTGEFSAESITMAELARSLTQELSGELGRVIVDRTGIEGRYDVKLKWTPDAGQAAADDGTADAGPSLFTAMQEQLGLKLESSKGPVQVLVIEHVEMPTAN